MKVVLDGLILFLNNGQIGNYSKSIVDNLIKYSSLDLDIIKDYEIVSSEYDQNSIELLLNRKSNDYSNLTFFLNNKKPNLYHCLNNGFSIPKSYDFNYVMSVNDLMPIYHENLCSMEYVSNFFSKFPYGVLNSSYILCPSVACKDNFLDNFSIDENKVFVNYGVVSKFYTNTDKFLSSIYIKSKFNIEEEFIVFSGDFNERKNIHKCLILLSKLKNYIPNLKLLILSNDFFNRNYLDKLKMISQKLNIYNDVIYLKKLSVVDKVNIFNTCLFFIDLSIYEDVNIDIVEAFSCKTPIICSDIDLYKEYFGDIVFYYSDDLDCKIILDYIYGYRLNNKGLVLNKFSSDISLKSLLNIYNKFK
ncbi:MAG: glycosyltransferase [Romboutsia sp.]|uniref:glycosyltransferase n=1 Tax=Romboutsia sp. TaxID=1965302 RepID=UPI003F396323